MLARLVFHGLLIKIVLFSLAGYSKAKSHIWCWSKHAKCKILNSRNDGLAERILLPVDIHFLLLGDKQYIQTFTRVLHIVVTCFLCSYLQAKCLY